MSTEVEIEVLNIHDTLGWEKCSRCWRYTEEVGDFYFFPDICFRCYTCLYEMWKDNTLSSEFKVAPQMRLSTGWDKEWTNYVFESERTFEPPFGIHPNDWLEIVKSLNYLAGEIRYEWYKIAEQIAVGLNAVYYDQLEREKRKQQVDKNGSDTL